MSEGTISQISGETQLSANVSEVRLKAGAYEVSLILHRAERRKQELRRVFGADVNAAAPR